MLPCPSRGPPQSPPGGTISSRSWLRGGGWWEGAAVGERKDSPSPLRLIRAFLLQVLSMSPKPRAPGTDPGPGKSGGPCVAGDEARPGTRVRTLYPDRLSSNWRTGPACQGHSGGCRKRGVWTRLRDEEGEIRGGLGVLSMGLLPCTLEGEVGRRSAGIRQGEPGKVTRAGLG